MALWNPWHGCEKYSAGCLHCYVYRTDSRFDKDSKKVTKNSDFDLPLRLSRDGISLRPMNDGRPFAVRGLAVRGATLDVEMTGVGTNAACELNGVPLPRAFLPWSAIQPGRNALRIRLLPLAP